MGYYDQDYENEGRRKQKGNRGGAFLAGIVGAILGGLLIIVAIPALSNLGILPYEMGTDEENNDITNGEGAGVPAKNISVNVNTAVTEIVNQVSDAVVGVVNIQEAGFWNEKGEAGTGSGVIYKKDDNNAFVVTNHHVIAGATQVEISLSNGERIPATIVGSDELMDLAVLKVTSNKIEQVGQFGNSDKVKVGEPVIAIGNPLGLQFSGSVTQGIISGTERAVPIDLDNDGQIDWNAEVLQTDAAINPGNSGGALINIDGKVIGINSMKIAQSAVEGIGLSIPSNLVRPIIEDLEKYGEVRRPYMGIGMRSLSDISSYHWQETLKLPKDVTTGVVVMGVEPLSPASKVGLKEFDVITEFADKKVDDILQLRKYLYQQKVGDTIKFTYYRGGKKQQGSMKLGEQQRLHGS
ncbi:S1C family serine protease [Metabacillus fastidiosus]|uniref:S1C family serine protease n=1 Tax=Metabacillus fastidiosus TaxID=1458 RepID=UPI003D29B48D